MLWGYPNIGWTDSANSDMSRCPTQLQVEVEGPTDVRVTHSKARRFKSVEIGLNRSRWPILDSPFCPHRQSMTRTDIKGVRWFNILILSSLPNLNPRPTRHLQNVWHQYHPPSLLVSRILSVRWWRRQSHPHSWREVSLTSIQWCTNCT